MLRAMYWHIIMHWPLLLGPTDNYRATIQYGKSANISAYIDHIVG